MQQVASERLGASVQPGFSANLEGAVPSSLAVPSLAGSRDIPIAELGIRRLCVDGDRGDILRLRRQLDLAAVTSVDPLFERHEKKETKWAWSSVSSSMAR